MSNGEKPLELFTLKTSYLTQGATETEIISFAIYTQKYIESTSVQIEMSRLLLNASWNENMIYQ